MEFIFTYNPGDDELIVIREFYHSLSQVSLEQHPDWPAIEKENVKYCYFIAKESGNYTCFAVITENLSRAFPVANIRFGPLFKNEDQLVQAVQSIHAYYKRKGFLMCSIQLGIATGAVADYIEYAINKTIRVKYFFDRENWSSLWLDLSKPEDEIFRRFSKGHKSDIKKSIKAEMKVMELTNDMELEELGVIFEKMNKTRGLENRQEYFLPYLKRVNNFFTSNNTGTILIVKDHQGVIVGGILLAFQGDQMRFFKGASDPEYRHLPTLHLALWEAIMTAREKGFKYFDFWGYNHFVGEEDQIFYVNRFKKGFGGEYVFYPKRMYFIFKPVRYYIYRKLKAMKTGFSKKP
jgi:hypothetical protein